MPAKPAKAAAKAAKRSASKSAKTAKAAKKPKSKSQTAPKKKPVLKAKAKTPKTKAKAKQPAIKAKAPKAAAKKPVQAAPKAPVKAAAKPIPAHAASTPRPAFNPAQRTAPAVHGARTEPMSSTPAVAVKKPANKSHGFKTNEHIVYPAHGVGQIASIEEQEIAGYKLELFVITFAKDKMTLRVPISKIDSVGMRKLSGADIMQRALDTLKGRARVKRTMWSRRAQEYEAKINSGDLIAIAEVVRDLHRAETQPEQSYSERQLYEAALDRMARELAAVEKLTDSEAIKKIEAMLAKGPKRGAAKDEAETAEAEVDEAEAA